jgi:hypothetical protein
MIPLVWLAREGVAVNCRWDEMLVTDIVTGAQKRSGLMPEVFETDHIHPGMRYAIVSFPAGAHELKDVGWLNAQLALLERVVLFLSSDEAQVFPVSAIAHPQVEFWVQLPRPEKHYRDNTTFITEGSGRAWKYADPSVEKTLAWFYAGQVNHRRRQEAVDAMVKSRIRPNVFKQTEGFLLGLDREVYLAHLASAKMAPAPAGATSQSSFRTCEALELGAVPIVDALRADKGGRGYWEMVMPEVHMPRVENWPYLGTVMANVRDDWENLVVDVHADWHWQRRAWAHRLARQARWLQGDDVKRDPHPITVVIPTSPIPSHPSIEIIEDTIRSVRARTDAEILIMVDGVREEQKDRRLDYLEYVRRVLLAAEQWFNVTPIVFTEHLHQAEMMRRTLQYIDDEYVLFVEHDTPLIGEIDFAHIIEMMMTSDLNLMRFHHEAQVLDAHKHLMIGSKPTGGFWPTMQWSQRPHLARAAWYRKVIDGYFDPSARTMIEDVMYGVLANARHNHPDRVWERWRTALYCPEGDSIKRSEHTDGRAGDPKYGNRYRYGRVHGQAPPGAPNEDVGL